jgi:hypothetical protein
MSPKSITTPAHSPTNGFYVSALPQSTKSASVRLVRSANGFKIRRNIFRLERHNNSRTIVRLHWQNHLKSIAKHPVLFGGILITLSEIFRFHFLNFLL